MTESGISKDGIRRQMRLQRAALSPDWVASHSEQVADRFVALDAFIAAETVCLYLAITGEVQLDKVMRQCWADGKRVLAPAYRETEGVYGFKEMAPDTACVEGHWNVPEPVVDGWADVGPAACVAVPGVAFDDGGARVGHGGGYYDRLLAAATTIDKAVKVGVCFDFQRVERIPCETWDVGMDMVVSESRVTRLS